MTPHLLPLSFAFALSFAALRAQTQTAAGEKIRVACVGASVMAEPGPSDPGRENYAAQLQAQLGPRYDVRDFSAPGCTLLRAGDQPYAATPVYAQALAFNPHVVVIDLGGNDSKAANWAHHAAFAADARATIAAFRSLAAQPRVLLALPLPCFNPPSAGINDAIVVNELIPILRTVAYETHTELLDLHTAFLGKASWFADGIHLSPD